MSEADWFCHCCSAKNYVGVNVCRICGRNESYVLPGHHLPLHGSGAQIYRPSHLNQILPNVFESDTNDWQSLHVAAYKGNYELVNALIKNGAEVNAITTHSHTPLFLAVLNNSLECVKALLANGAECGIMTSTERLGPLHIGCSMGNLDIVKYLVEKGCADIKEIDIMSRTPLHHAALGGHATVGSYLIQNGIDYKLMDAHGWCARQLAEYYGHRKFQEIIVRAGLTVKQSVIKDLPPADWQGPLWDEFLGRKEGRRRTERSKKPHQLQLK
jgi:ankyrin repeat protein